jgi:hypothetical protein
MVRRDDAEALGRRLRDRLTIPGAAQQLDWTIVGVQRLLRGGELDRYPDGTVRYWPVRCGRYWTAAGSHRSTRPMRDAYRPARPQPYSGCHATRRGVALARAGCLRCRTPAVRGGSDPSTWRRLRGPAAARTPAT